MGLLQKAVETYDAHQQLVGKSQVDHETLAPICHIVTRADIEITLDETGRFQQARAVDKSEPKILIPATADSGGRTSAPCAHPLCDQLFYLAPYDEKRHPLYVEQLERWVESSHSHPMLRPILQYIKAGTILEDLSRCSVIQLNEKGRPEKEKQLVRWRVVGIEGEESACWTNQSLFRSFIDWYQDTQRDDEPMLDMITGEWDALAKQHPKGIIPINGNAKLISANDGSGFTYRGRFLTASQAASVGYVSSQKAHNALRWLVAEQGVAFGGRTFLCWNPQGKKTPKPTGVFAKRSKTPVVSPTEYRENLRNTLNSWRSELPEAKDGVVIAAFDAATTGRLSLTYYNELVGSDFLQRLHDWDEWCCWPRFPYGIEAPSLRQIVNFAFGTLQNGKFDTKDAVLREQMQRLVACRVDRALLPSDIERSLVHRASRLELYGDDKKSNYLRSEILFTACAVIRKYHYDHKKEEWSMSLEAEKRDRSYQYGRLLAVLEKVERDTYGTDEGREPNAIRMQSVFCQRPLYAASTIEKQLERAYFPRLRPGSRVFYKNLIGEIMEMIHESPESEWNRPLKDTYLMGYYLQRSELYKGKKETDTTEQEEN